MSDCFAGLDPEYCPDLDDCHAELRALLPRGKAWDAAHRPATGLWGFWRALAHPFAYAHQRICDLRRQFWCQSVDELYDAWLVEYGLPDACDPFPDLCAKVAALGGTRCDYYQAIALRAGWVIECLGAQRLCGALAGLAQAGCAVAGGEMHRSRLTFTVYVSESPAFTGSGRGPVSAGCAVVGDSLDCDPDIGSLRCLLERVVPAHVELVYVLAYPQEVLGADAATPLTDGAGSLILVNQ